MVDRVKKLLKTKNVRYRYFDVYHDRVIIGIEGTKATYPELVRELRKLKFIIYSSVYGRWVLKYTGFDDLQD